MRQRLPEILLFSLLSLAAVSNSHAQNFVFDSFTTINGNNNAKITASLNIDDITVNLGDATSSALKKGGYGTFSNANDFLNDGTTIYTHGGNATNSAIKFVHGNRWLDIEIINNGSAPVHFTNFGLDYRRPVSGSATSYRLSTIDTDNGNTEVNTQLFSQNVEIDTYNNVAIELEFTVPAQSSQLFRFEVQGATGNFAQTQIDNILFEIVSDRYFSYEDWSASRFTAQEISHTDISDLAADPDNDGMINKLEYILGFDPKQSDGSWYSDTSFDNNGITITHKGAPGAFNKLKYSLTTTEALDAISWNAVPESKLLDGNESTPPIMQATISTFNDTGFMRLENIAVRHKSSKKGVAFGSALKNQWGAIFTALDPAWHYSWGRVIETEHPDGLEFVPQFWGSNSVTLAEIQALKPHILSGKVKYLLGFNEPDLASQANMTVAEAITKWQLLENLLQQEGLLDKVQLVSPVVASDYINWLDPFLAQAQILNLKVDYICLHLYSNPSSDTSSTFLNRLNVIYQNHIAPHGKKVWLKEFSVRDNTANNAGDNIYSEEYVESFMGQVIPVLEETDWIFRYAWFSSSVNGNNFPKQETSLMYDDAGGGSTSLGDYYKRIQSWQ